MVERPLFKNMEKFDDRYRIPSARLPKWDYGGRGTYFVTICTENRMHYFGEIVEHIMQLTDIGRIAWQEWKKIPELRPDMNIGLGAYVVMPNHFHGIIHIGNNPYNTFCTDNCRDAMHHVSTDESFGKNPSTENINRFGPQSKNLASIIRGFKSSVTTFARKSGNNYFAWQPRFYDVIIHDSDTYVRKEYYIKTNPINWENDQFYH
jgi:putative transposase